MADNPGAGGGKIRSKRSTVVKKPYSRSASQRKSFFSRVTSSFKSLLDPITPRWLSKQADRDSERRSSHDDDDSEEPSTSAYHQEMDVRTNHNLKRSPLSRPPMNRTTVVSSQTTTWQYEPTPPSTPSQETTPKMLVSTRKEGLLKHLSMGGKRPKVEVESPLPSESSFLRNDLKHLSTCDNASVTSSSSCSSSLVPLNRKDVPGGENDADSDQKVVCSSSVDSAASSRTSSSQQQPTMSSQKRPRFNPALFGMPSLGASKAFEGFQSSFYDGRVRYGGANSSGSSSYFATPYKVPTVTKVKVRHVNQTTSGHSSVSSRSSTSPASESSFTGMSSTAKKILQTLEKMSTPLNDARKIPTLRRTPYYPADRIRRRTAAAALMPGGLSQPPPISGLSSPLSARLRKRRHVPSNNSLLVRNDRGKPAADEVTDVVSSEEPGPSQEVAQVFNAVKGLPAPIASLSSSANMLKFRPSQSSFGCGGKMKSQRRITSHYSAMQEEADEELEMPDLPDVALPITTLPSFNFGKSLMMTSTPAVKPPEKEGAHSSERQPEYNFALPVAKTMNLDQGTSSTTSPKFQFPSPLSKASSASVKRDTPKARPSANFATGSKNGTSPLLVSDSKKASEEKPSKRKSSLLAMQKTRNSSGLEPAKSLKTGSVLDILGDKTKVAQSGATSSASSSQSLPSLKQAKSGWTCSVCMVPNEDTLGSCVACTTPKPGGVKKLLVSSAVPKKTGWDCTTCLVPNDSGVEKCVACEEPRPGSVAGLAAKTAAFKATNFAPQKRTFAFGVSQKPDTATNGKEAMEERISLGAQFKKAKGTWECGACLVQNDSTSMKCVACETSKPGTVSSALSTHKTTFLSKTSQFKFGISSSGSSDKTKKSAPEWECEVCMVPNPDERKTCEACDSPRPGTQKQLNTSFKFGESSSGLFKFGVPSTHPEQLPKDTVTRPKTETADSSTSTAKTLETISTLTAPVSSKPAFSFGVPLSKANEASTLTATLPTQTISFGVSSSSKADTPSSSDVGSAIPQQGTSASTFSFGLKRSIVGDGKQKKEGETNKQAKNTETAATGNPLGTFSAASTGLPGFQFSANTQPVNKPVGTDPKPTNAPLQPASSNNPLFSGTKALFGAKIAEPPKNTLSASSTPVPSNTQLPPPPYQFGGQQQSETKVFTVPDRKPEGSKPETATAPFQFGVTKPAASGLFQFSGSSSSSNQPSATSNTASSGKSLLGFGAGSSSKPQEGEKPSSAFGSGSNAVSKGFTGFNTGSAPKVPVNQTSEAKKPVFAGFETSTTPAAQTPGGFFGSPSLASGKVFGGSAAPSFGGVGGAFGTGSNSGTVFGAAASSNAAPAASSNVGIFGSGGSASNTMFAAPQSSDASASLPKPSFNFGAAPVKQSTQDKPSGFQFGSGGAQPNFQFGAGNQQQNSVGAPFNFGQSDKSAFSTAAPTAGGFAFGAPSLTQSNGGFQFGAGSGQPSTQQPAATENKLFVFGGANDGGTSASGFNFSASVPPSANFGMGQPSAPQPGAGGGLPRFSMGEQSNPFNATRSTTPNQRRRAVARRKLKK